MVLELLGKYCLLDTQLQMYYTPVNRSSSHMYKFAVTREILERIAKRIPTRIFKDKAEILETGGGFVRDMKANPNFWTEEKKYFRGKWDRLDSTLGHIPHEQQHKALALKRVLGDMRRSKRFNVMMGYKTPELDIEIPNTIELMKKYKDFYRRDSNFRRRESQLRQAFEDKVPRLIPVKRTNNIPINMAPGNHKFVPDSPEASRALRAVLKLHEKDELRATGKMSKVFVDKFGHNNPSVILREHNNITTLPPSTPGKQPLLESGFMKRRQQREIPAIFPNTEFQHGVSPRLSRHAIKRLTEDYQRRNSHL